MDKQRKSRIAFAITMGFITTGIISFALIALNLGFTDKFLLVWAQSWAVGYAIVIPAILAIGPWLQGEIERLVR